MGNVDDLIKLLQVTHDDLLAAIRSARINPNQVQLTALADLSKVLGLVRAGEFRAGNNVEPGQGFTGVRMGYPPFDYSGQLWHLVGINDDIIQFGLNAADGTAWAGGGAIRMTAGGILVYNGTVNSGAIQSDGDVFFGSNIAAVGTTSLCIFSNDQTYNGETLGAGDILIGDNTAGKGNILWDASAGIMYFRTGTTVMNQISSGSLQTAGCRIRRSTNQTLTNNAVTKIAFSVEDYDDAGFADLAVSNTRITIPTGYGGYYLVGYYVATGAAGSNATWVSSVLLLNGIDDITMQIESNHAGWANGVGTHGKTSLINLVAGDYIELSMNNNASGGLIQADTHTTLRPVMFLAKLR
jgi:hypothetical protein